MGLRHARPSRRDRALIATLVASLTALWVRWGLTHIGNGTTDFDQLWFAARAVLAGHDPYSLIGPGRAFDWPWGFFYPLAAVLPAVPFAPLPLPVAQAAYAFALAWCFVYVLTSMGWYRLTAVMSGAYLSAMSLLQWSPLASCAILAPAAFGWMVPGKPNLGMLTVAAARERRALAWMVGWTVSVTLLAFAVLPSWLASWRAEIAGAAHVRPYLLRPGGFLLLLGLLRWRRPEGRLLAALAIVPNTSGAADGLLLFTMPHSFREGLVLALLTHGVNFYLALQPRAATHEAAIASSTAATLAFMYLPVLLVVLRRPNEGAAPPFLERLTAPLPRWLRGTPAMASSRPQ